jgi:hypothetical protein
MSIGSTRKKTYGSLLNSFVMGRNSANFKKFVSKTLADNKANQAMLANAIVTAGTNATEAGLRQKLSIAATAKANEASQAQRAAGEKGLDLTV